MKPNYRSFLHVAFVFFVGASLQLTKGSLNANPRLKDVIEEAERESKILANEINRWLLQESASLLETQEGMHFRSRRSIDEDEEDAQMDTNLSSEVSQLIVRRDVGNNDKKHPKEKNGVPVIKGKLKKVKSVPVAKCHHQDARSSDSNRLLKNQGLDMQAGKHHAKKSATNKKADKLKTKAEELSKANLVKALIGGDSGAKRYSGVPEEAYKELAEFIAASSSDQSTIETNSKKSDISRPSTKVQGRHKQLTKKHKHVLDILSKLAPNVLRKYFHRKGLDKYWKVMENIKKINAAKQSKKESKRMDNANISKAKQNKKEKFKVHKDTENVKQKVVASKKPSSSSGIKHLEKDVLLKKQANLHKNDPKKEVSQHKVVKDKAVKLHKPEHLKSSSKDIVIVKPAVETHVKKSKKVKDAAADHQKKQSHKTIRVELLPNEIPQRPHKAEKMNLFKAIKSKNAVKVVKEDDKIVSKSVQTVKEEGSHTKDSVTDKIHKKRKSAGVKDAPKQKPEKKVTEPVTVTGTAPAKNIKDKPKDTNDSTAPDTKAVKVETSQVKLSRSPVKSKKLVEPVQAVENKDSSKNQIKNTQEEKATPQHQVNAVVISAPNKMINKNRSMVADEKPEEISKTPAITAHHVIKTTHAEQLEVKHDKSSQAKQENPASGKIDFLKEKIRKTNNLKFKVAQALLAHCETQNRLRQLFDEVNSSLKKAAVLAKAIGSKFGIKQSDIENMTSEHTEGAVEQFLNQLF